jgi:hypothetical protein
MKTVLFFLFFSVFSAFAQDSLYSKVFHTANIDLKGQAVTVAGDGGLVIAAQYNWMQSAVFRIDSLGNTLWGKGLAAATGVVQWDNVLIKTIETLEDSTYIIAGECISIDGTKLHAVCAKISSNGDTLWTRVLTNPNMQYNTYHAASATVDSGVVLVAKTSTATSAGYFVVKYSANGDLQWSKVVEGLEVTDTPCAIQSLADSTIIVSVPNSLNQCVVMHLFSDGTLDWAQRYPDLIIQDIERVDSTVVLSGRSATQYIPVLIKSALDGAILWAKSYSSMSGGGFMIDVCVRQDSSFVMTSGEQALMGYAISADKNGVAALELNLALASFAVQNSEQKGVFLVGNGPMYGVKAGSLMNNYHIGVVRADSMLNTSGGGFFSCSWGVGQAFSSDLPLVPLPFTPQNSGTLSAVNAIFQYNDLILDSYIGCVDFFGGVAENSIDNEINIFPNPSNGLFHIEQLSQHSLEIEISDINGRNIENKRMHALQDTIDLSAQKAGIYFYKVRRDDGQVKNGKLVILH